MPPTVTPGPPHHPTAPPQFATDPRPQRHHARPQGRQPQPPAGPAEGKHQPHAADAQPPTGSAGGRPRGPFFSTRHQPQPAQADAASRRKTPVLARPAPRDKSQAPILRPSQALFCAFCVVIYKARLNRFTVLQIPLCYILRTNILL